MPNIDLWSRPAREIPLEDVLAFLEQRHEEHVRLDYKEDFSGKNTIGELANDLAAFANTQGGVLLIGVKEDRPSGRARPVLPVKGRHRSKPTENSEIRIRDVALNPIHVYPPIKLDLQVYQMPEDRELILVQVTSDDEIHYTEGRTGFYIRDHNRCVPIRGTNEDQELLRSRREQLHRLRDQLLQGAVSRYNWVIFRENGSRLPPSFPFPQLLISMLPKIPSHSLTTVSTLQALIQKCIVRYDHINFPEGSKVLSGMDQIQFVIPRAPDNSPPHRSFEAYTNGLLFFGRCIGDVEGMRAGGQLVTFDDHEILVHLIRFLWFAGKFYRAVGYLGLADLNLWIIIPQGGAQLKFQGNLSDVHLPPPELHMTKEIGLFEFDHQLFSAILIDLYKKLAWAGGIGMDVQDKTLETKISTILPNPL